MNNDIYSHRVKIETIAKLNPEYISGASDKQICYLEISAVSSGVIVGDLLKYSLSSAPSRAKRVVAAGDTILSTVRPNRKAFFYFQNPPYNLVVSTGFAVLRAKETVISKYLYYAVTNQEFTDYLTANAKGSAYPAVDTGIINRGEIWLPPLSTQRKIAAILSTYDDLIKNNTRRIHILEEMAQAIYREWFVNFRFPGHKNVKMVESEIGLIPEGWEIKSVPEAVAVNPTTSVAKETKKPFVTMQCLSNNSMLIDGFEYRTGNSGSKFKNKDTLFARITPCLENGKTGFVQFLPTDESVAIGSTEFIVLRSKTLCPEFVYLLARSDSFRDNAIKSMTGASGRQRVQESCFEKYLIAHPSPDMITRFQSLVAPVFEQIHALAQKNSNLRRARDMLLPKLISGEVDVSEMDIDIGEEATV